MTQVVSKNLYELLGNNHDEDSDKEPEPPVKVIEKTPARTDKRNAPREAPAAPANAGQNRRQPGGNEGAFRSGAGRDSNRTKPTEDGARAPNAYNGRGRGPQTGRGGRSRPTPRDDRHSKHVGGDSAKQAGQGWGAETGTAELNDEVAGEAIAGAEVKAALKEDGDAAPVNADGRTLEEQEADNSISYADYLIQKAERLSLQAAPARKANEGAKEDKKWAQASELKKTEEEEFIAGSTGKKTRTRERKQKEVLDIDQRFVEQPSRDAGRGGRGRGDGPRRGGERGAFRGDRGAARGPRGDGAGRGRGAPRGGAARGGAPRAAPVAIDDTKAFPSLGA